MTTILCDVSNAIVYTDSQCTYDLGGIVQHSDVEKAWYWKGGVITGTGSLEDLIYAKYCLSRHKEPKRFKYGTTVVYIRKAYRIIWYTVRSGKVTKCFIPHGLDTRWRVYGSGANMAACLLDANPSMSMPEVLKYVAGRDEYTNDNLQVFKL